MAIITLSTDIGVNDFITGAFKGQLLNLDSTLNIVDISHQLSSSNFTEVAYICENAFKYYPDGAIHIILVNMFEFNFSHVLLARYGQQFILCPDNGILTMIFKEKPKEVFKVPVDSNSDINTINYLSVIAMIVQKLASGRYPIQIGEKFEGFMERYPLRPMVGENWIEGQIIFIDKFENVVVNISREEFESSRRGRNFKISFARDNIIEGLKENYANANSDDCIACFNSADMLELSIKNGNMAGLFGLQGYKEENKISQEFINSGLQNNSKRNWFYHTIRVFFE